MDQMKRINRMKKVFRNIKSCVRQFDMPIRHEQNNDCCSSLWTEWDDGQHVNEMLIVYQRNMGIVSIFSYYNEVPESRRHEVIGVLFKLNERLQMPHFTIDEENHRICCYADLLVNGLKLGKKRFRRTLIDILKCVFLYSDTIAKIAGSGQAETGPVEGHPVEVDDYVESIAT